jgi:uncharacterized protein YecT (DUF1311 family)
MMIIFLAAAAAAPAPATQTRCPDKTGNQGTINYCAQMALERVEQKLSVRWDRTLKIAATQDSVGETYAVDTLKASQDAWRAYQDAECRVESAPIGYMGSMDRYLYLSCKAAMAERRIADLKDLEKAYRD